MSEIIQIRRQIRIVEPDSEKFKANKNKFAWDETEIKASTPDGEYTNEGDYEVNCGVTGAKKVMAYRLIELPTTTPEAEQEFQSLSPEGKLALVRYVKQKKEEENLSTELRESYESEEKKAKRLEKKQAEAATKIKEWLGERLAAGDWPDKEEARAKVAEIHQELGLPIPGAPTN